MIPTNILTNDTKATTGGLGASLTVLLWYGITLAFDIPGPSLEVYGASQAVITMLVQGYIKETN